MTRTTHRRRRQRARAARQAPALCQTALAVQPRVTGVAARAALRAAGLPPPLAAALRGRLRLTPDPEAGT
jgi:hypothetical protein